MNTKETSDMDDLFEMMMESNQLTQAGRPRSAARQMGAGERGFLEGASLREALGGSGECWDLDHALAAKVSQPSDEDFETLGEGESYPSALDPDEST